MFINLPPHSERSESVFTVIDRLRDRATEVEGIQAWFQPVQELSIEDRVARTQYQFTLTSLDSETLGEWVPRVIEQLRELPELTDVAADLQHRGQELYLEIDRDAAARLGVSVSTVAQVLQNAFGQRQISTLFTQSNQYRVVLEMDPALAAGPDALRSIHVPAPGGQVPLASLARLHQRATPLMVNHQGQFPVATVSFNLAAGTSLGQAVDAIEQVRQQLQLPEAIEIRFQGAAQAFQASLANSLWLILAAILTMYIVLGVLYESTIHPLTILSTLPSATVGALLALLLTGRALDMIAVVGVVLLIGLVKKNGIMMVDFALEAQRVQGMAPREAIHRAAMLRFRPILMTTLAALFGALPLMLASGSGAELRQPLGLVMVGGLLVSQVLTLFTTPVVYLLCGRLLPVAPLPEVDFPVITVNAGLPGASPESMAATVATPLERALGAISGVVAITSSSNQGSTQIMLQFELDRDIDEAAREVQAAINSVRGELPAGMPGNPQYRKVNPSQAPIMALALSSPNLASSALYDAASTILAQKLAQIAGVGEVSVSGASLPAVRVQLDPGALLHNGIALDEVRNAITQSTALYPLGFVEEQAHRWRLGISDSLRTAEEYRNLVIRHRDGAVVRLGDLATVTDSVENRYTSGFHNHDPAVILMISRQSGANIVRTIDAIHAQLPHLQALMPADSELAVVMDRSPVIRATLNEAQFTLMLASLLVVLVVWLFLSSARTALIPSVALPVSLVGSFVVMYLYGFSLNNLSLMALIVAAGLVVDDAIVVLENVERHIESGLPPLRAALRGAGEVGFTLLAMNLALVVVFVSILFMGGVVERLFREFSITLAAAMLISLLVSLTRSEERKS